ncbi:MAG: HAMP domain-containing sensor histidine kinase [Bdellovibrionota bacterium]
MIGKVLGFVRTLHNRRPLFWTVVAFIVVVITTTILSVWWNVLLVQNHAILQQLTRAANDPSRANLPLALLMMLGILCSLVVVTGLVYLFLRLIRTVQLNIAQSQFIAAVTHELRSPVAGLQLMLETIRDPTTPPERRQEFERCMYTDLLRLRGLVDQVLDTARLESMILGAPREEIALSTFLEKCVGTFEPRLKATGGTIKVTPFPNDLRVRANQALLATTLNNVLDNALKYSKGSPEVLIDASLQKKTVLIQIKDHGVGIPRKQTKKIFRRFYRAHEKDVFVTRSGTGLGLYYARLAMRAQGGRISAESEGIGLGSTFRIEVPRV